jgi:hypothetical protein
MLVQSSKSQNICFRSFLRNPLKKKTTTFLVNISWRNISLRSLIMKMKDMIIKTTFVSYELSIKDRCNKLKTTSKKKDTWGWKGQGVAHRCTNDKGDQDVVIAEGKQQSLHFIDGTCNIGGCWHGKVDQFWCHGGTFFCNGCDCKCYVLLHMLGLVSRD